MGSLGLSKQLLRKRYKDLRSTLVGDAKIQLDHKICERALELIERKSQSPDAVWTAYMPIKNEVDPSGVIETSQSRIRWAFPVVQNESMKFFIPKNPQAFRLGVLGIQEPDLAHSQEMQTHDITGCLVPGLAFDKKGGRLGYGKGYYDRFLQTFKGCSVALAYELQVTNEELPRESTDASVQFIVTESEIITCS